MQLPEMFLYRHPEIQTWRPYGFSVDGDGWLWEGCCPGVLYAHNLQTAEVKRVPLPEARGFSLSDVHCFKGKIIAATQEDVYLVYDPQTGACAYPRLPGEYPTAWYGLSLPGDKFALFDRSGGQIVIFDDPNATPRSVICPYLSASSDDRICDGQLMSDGLIYSMISKPSPQIIRFDPASETFVDAIPFAVSVASPSGYFEADGILFISDALAGRLLTFDLHAERWQELIPIPDYGEVFGFCGGCTEFRGRGYFCISTYNTTARLDPKTREIIMGEDWKVGVDGRRPRFLDRLLVFDPREGFDYLTVPAQPDGIPKVCYQWTDGERLVTTGYIIPFSAPNEPGDKVGDWIVWQSVSAVV